MIVAIFEKYGDDYYHLRGFKKKSSDNYAWETDLPKFNKDF
jgi:hypothetical protein